jgi:perosamine synthetase
VKSKGVFEHTAIGFNYRISNLHAALFIAQWERIPEILNQRNFVFEKYFEYFKKLDINFASNQFPSFVNPWLMTIRLPGLSGNMPILREQLLERGIETRPGFKIFSEHEYLKKQIRIASDLDISKTIAKEIISLPTFPELDEESIAFICENLAELLK